MAVVVKTPAARHGFSEHSTAKSSPSGLFTPVLTAPARKPFGEVTVPEAIALNPVIINEGTIIALSMADG
jgi:hypothetical protein